MSSDSSWLSPRLLEARQNLPRALAELFVLGNLHRVRPRLGVAGQVEVRHRRVERGRRDQPARGGDALLAARDLARLTRGRVVGLADAVDLELQIVDGGFEATDGAGEGRR